jgi:beta-galactosidase
VLGPRTGYADHEARARNESAPGRLAEVAGVHYDEFSNLMSDVPLHTAADSPLRMPHDAVATKWADNLVVDDAQVLAEYQHPHFRHWPAITTRQHGAGRVTCVGTIPGRSLARALATWLAPTPSSGWRDLPASVTATTGTAPDGRRVHVIHNWSWTTRRVAAPADLTDVLTGTAVPLGASPRLGPWDVRVFVSERRSASVH